MLSTGSLVAGLVVLASCTGQHLRGAAPARQLAGDPSGLTAPDIALLNFALQLECLESNFYAKAIGTTLPDFLTMNGDGDRGPGTVTGEASDPDDPNLSVKIFALAQELFDNEVSHLDLLRGALMSDGGPCQDIALTKEVFQSVLTAAAIPGLSAAAIEAFDTYASDIEFLIAAFIFEDVGVTAYNGAAPLLAEKGLLTAAAAIHNVEAYHAGIIRSLLAKFKDVTVDDTTVGDMVNGIAALRDTLDAGAAGSDAGITKGAALLLGPFDTNGLVIPRTAEQVTRILTNGATGKGLFFPNGLDAIFELNPPPAADQSV